MTRLMKPLLATLALVFASLVHAQAPAAATSGGEPFQAGLHYVELEQPVRVQTPGKIEVVEVFWYGCSHCYDLEAPLEAWAAKLPDDVVLVRSPVVWNAVTELHARAFYTARALGALDKIHNPLFTALNVERKPLNTKARLAAFFEQQGVSREAFDKTFDSFGVTSQVNQAKARMLSYKVEGTPELLVNGKYRVTGRGVASQAGKLEVASWLIERERRAQATAP